MTSLRATFLAWRGFPIKKYHMIALLHFDGQTYVIKKKVL